MPLAHLARTLLDEPRWVETRAMLLDGTASVTGLSGDRRRFVASSAVWPLVAVVGRVEAPFITTAAAAAPRTATVLAAFEDGDHVAAALPGWRRVGATIHAWPAGAPLPDRPAPSQARVLEPADVGALGHLPKALRHELATAAAYSPIAGAFTGGAPVAFCYATAITETLWDISIDTLDGFRRRGLAGLAVRCLAAVLGERGKWPVWGAADDNPASLAAATRLGFVPAGRLALFTRP